MNKEFESELATFDLEDIPSGPLSLENFIQSAEGQATISVLKKVSTDPQKLIVLLLVAYQGFDIMEQLKSMGRIVEPGTKEREIVLKVASAGVVENLATILIELGQERLDMLIKALSPDEAVQ